ncbi:MAG: hypothetical protein HY914_00150 [Desulfomonile tiedjei]|nr:hypothetical protein [Desulfomonile tiedjei]
MNTRWNVLIIAVSLWLGLLLGPAYAQHEKGGGPAPPVQDSERLIGLWEVTQTKEPAQPYRAGYKGKSFVSKGPNAFCLLMEYGKDGTFRRISRIGSGESVEEGTWKLAGRELRHQRKGAVEEEVLYLRFDNPDQFTTIEVYEGTPDPGLFVQFKRLK